MSELPTSKLSDIADVIDSLHKTPKYSETGYPMVRCVDLNYGRLKLKNTQYVSEEVFNEYSRRYSPSIGDIIITRVGANFGVTSYVEETEFCLGQNTAAIIPTNVNARYLYYILNSFVGRQQMNMSVAGAAQPTLSLKAIKNIDVPRLGDIAEKKIATIAGALDDKIELNRQTNQTLEQMAQAIFKSWFVDFEPTRAKIAAKLKGQDPERAIMAAISGKAIAELDQLSPDTQQQLRITAALFPDTLVDSELGEIPKGWEASSLVKHFDVVMGQSPKGDTYNENGDGMLFFQGRRDFGFRYPTPRVYTTDPKRLAKTGDTLISVRAPVGDRNMAIQECCLGRGVAGIRHKSGARSFTYTFIGHIEKNLSDSGSDGTVFSSINKNELGAVGFIAPTENLLAIFEEKIASLDQRVEVNSKEIVTLEEMRDSLLPRLLSGSLEI
ncbi:MAG: type I restriction enzyme S subunit [Paraglaciecola sp.]|jgi:type I restriction enzyme S subunit